MAYNSFPIETKVAAIDDISGLTAALANKLPATSGFTFNGVYYGYSTNPNITVPAVSDGVKGDIVVSGGGASWTIPINTVTVAKMAQIAAGTVLANVGGSTANPAAVSIVSQIKPALNLAAADVAGSIVTFNSSRSITMADAGALINFSAVTATIPTGLTAFNAAGFPPASGSVTFSWPTGVTTNGVAGPSTLTRSGTNPFNILQTGTNTFILTDNAVGTGDVTQTGTQTLTNKTIDGGNNTLQNIPQSAVTGLSTSLSNAGKLIYLAKQLTPVTTTGANTTETTVFTFTVPGGTLTAGDRLQVWWSVENPNSATTKTFQAYFGGTLYNVDSNTTQLGMKLESDLMVLGTNSQIGPLNYCASSNNSGNLGLPLTKDLTANQTLTLTVKWGTADGAGVSIITRWVTVHVVKGS